MTRVLPRRVAGAIALIAATFLPSIADAQSVGMRAVAVLETLCGPYMSGTPFHQAATAAGFGYDDSVQEYYLGPDGTISTTTQADVNGCKFVAYFTAPERDELLFSLIDFANSIDASLTRDGDYCTDAEFQYWITEWESDAQTLMLTEMRGLDDTWMVDGFEVMVVTLRRTE